MRWVSFDDTEAGVLAIGAQPVGIIAIGGMPVGIVAIGIAGAGGVSLSCGGGAGLVVISCGVGVGGFAAGVGLGVGLKSAIVGVGLNVLETKTVVVGSEPEPSRFDLQVRHDAVAIERVMSGELREGWVLLEAVRPPYQPWTLLVEGEPVELTDAKLRRKLTKLTVTDPRVLAHLVAEDRIDASEPQADYRTAAPTRRVLRCDDLLAGDKEPGAARERTVERVDWESALTWKLPLLLALITLAAWLVIDRLADLELDRKAEVTFQARVTRTAGNGPGMGKDCTIRAWLRTDGAARRKATAEVTCDGAVLYSRTKDGDASFDEVQTPDGRPAFRYRIAYADEGQRPNDDYSGRPSLTLDTRARRAVVESWDAPVYRVELEVDELSAERTGTPLLFGNLPP